MNYPKLLKQFAERLRIARNRLDELGPVGEGRCVFCDRTGDEHKEGCPLGSSFDKGREIDESLLKQYRDQLEEEASKYKLVVLADGDFTTWAGDAQIIYLTEAQYEEIVDDPKKLRQYRNEEEFV